MRIPGIGRQQRTFVAISGAAAFAAILGIVTAPESAAASAAPQGVTGSAYSAPPSVSAARTTIHCELHIDPPQVSAGPPGTVSVSTNLTCSAPVSALGISVGLYKNGMLVAQSGPVSNNNSATIQGSAATACSSSADDQYFGKAQGSVTYPPGYSPASWTAATRSYTFTGLNC